MMCDKFKAENEKLKGELTALRARFEELQAGYKNLQVESRSCFNCGKRRLVLKPCEGACTNFSDWRPKA